MKRTLLRFAAAIPFACIAILPLAADASYRYAHVAAEYAIDLPDAPTGVTIWAGKGNIPYLEKQPKYGAVGEVATLNRTDPTTGESFNIEITFLKSDRDSLLTLTRDKMKETLQNETKNIRMENQKFSFSAGTDTLKWATLTGFSVNKKNDLMFHAMHYLTGVGSIMVLKVEYNLENKIFDEYYKKMSASIAYIGR